MPAWLSGSKPTGAAPSPPVTDHKEGQPSPSQLVRAGSIKQVDSSKKLAGPAMATKDTIMRSGRLDALYMTLLQGNQLASCTHVRCSFTSIHALLACIAYRQFAEGLATLQGGNAFAL